MLFASLGLILSLARAAPAFEITGWVSAPAGARVTVEARPLPGLHEASLRAYGAGSGPALSRTETVDGERFRLRVDGPGIWLVVVRATDAVPMEVLVAPLVGDLELPPVTLEADEGSRLDLEVGRHPKSRAAAEPPLVQARVVADARLQHLRWRPHRPPRLSTDGALRFPRRRGESLELELLVEGVTRRVRSTTPLVIGVPFERSASEQRELEVLEPDGSPADAAVILDAEGWPIGVTRDGRANVRFRRAPLRIVAPDGRTATVAAGRPATPSGSPTRVPLPPRLPLSGTVEDADTGLGAGAVVWVADDPVVYAVRLGGWRTRSAIRLPALALVAPRRHRQRQRRRMFDQGHSHTYPVSMKNVTLALDEATVQAARRIAAERSTTLNAIIREFLEELTQRESRTAAARQRIVELCRASDAEVGPRTWTRAELHER